MTSKHTPGALTDANALMVAAERDRLRGNAEAMGSLLWKQNDEITKLRDERDSLSAERDKFCKEIASLRGAMEVSETDVEQLKAINAELLALLQKMHDIICNRLDWKEEWPAVNAAFHTAIAKAKESAS